MAVDRCVCHEITFERLLAIAERENLSLDGLKTRTGCCGGCGLCEPYLRLALHTGRTSFTPMSPDELRTALRQTDDQGQ